MRTGISLALAGLVALGTNIAMAAGSDQVTIKGSDTMVHLVTAWAEELMDRNEEIDISVTGGGSGTGIAALLNKTADIAASSRDMKSSEKDLAHKAGIDPVETTVALDGIAIIVHPSNPINELTMEQVRKIYTGEAKSWKDVGWKDAPIVALSRESSSGTYVFFQEHVLDKKDYAASVRLVPATAGIVQSVSSDEGTIGYVGLGYASEAKGKVKMLSIKKDAASPAVAPSEEAVVSGSYPIARPLFIYTAGKPEGKIKEYLEYALSTEGQKVVSEEGYVPVKR